MARRLPDSAYRRLFWSVIGGVVIAVVVATVSDALLGVLSGIATTATIFDLLGWWSLWPNDAESTSRLALRNEFDPRLEEVVVVVWALAGLITVALLLLLGKSDDRPFVALLALAGWPCRGPGFISCTPPAMPTCSTRTRPAGSTSHGHEPPAYRDFLYFSYNLGMTYQVSDTDVSSRTIRVVVLRHCLLSYAFGTVILATTINVIANVVVG